MLEFETNTLGKLRMLGRYINTVLLEKIDCDYENYIVASGFDDNTNTWANGTYLNTYKSALREFKSRIV